MTLTFDFDLILKKIVRQHQISHVIISNNGQDIARKPKSQKLGHDLDLILQKIVRQHQKWKSHVIISNNGHDRARKCKGQKQGHDLDIVSMSLELYEEDCKKTSKMKVPYDYLQ